MIANNEYMENIARKLDALNKMNGYNPQSNSTLKDDFDVIDYTGQAAINYMKKKQIIHLDSANGIYNSADAFDFYIKFENPIKNISSVKILEASIVLNTKIGNRTTLSFDDIFYIELNRLS